MGHPVTHSGRVPSRAWWAQNTHFITTPFVVGHGSSGEYVWARAAGGYEGVVQLKNRALYGQAAMQYRQPMHRVWSTRTVPSGSTYVAPTGQTFTHGAFRQWKQGRGRWYVPPVAS